MASKGQFLNSVLSILHKYRSGENPIVSKFLNDGCDWVSYCSSEMAPFEMALSTSRIVLVFFDDETL